MKEVDIMPELPEVETVKNGLLKKVKNRKILSCNVLWPGIIAYPDKETFIKNIANETINDITRRGKFIVFHLDNYFLISHLRMEGKYFIKEKDIPINKHDHVIFDLDNDLRLIYNDTRKFGKMYLLKFDDTQNSPLTKLGKEPWDDTLNISYLKDKFNKNKAIKTMLLDQEIITGIGNIYADEILFLSHINPEKPAKSLTNKNLTDIIKYTREVLEKSIAKGGTTIHTYTSVDGITGLFQQELLVHGKASKPCPNCQTKIIKTTVNQRGTYYCPHCQK